MKVSVIIVNYNVKYFLEVCLDSVYRSLTGIDGEVIVVDNHSTDGSNEMIRSRFPATVLLENKDNKGFSKANNQGVAIAKGEYILFLNPDTVVPEDFFAKMTGYMDIHPEAGAIGPRIIDGKGQYAPDAKKSFPTLSVALFKTTGMNKLFPRSPYFNKYYAVHIGEHEIAAVEGLSGCCMMVRTSVLPRIGGAFDEDYFMYCEDADLCYRIDQSGYKNIYFPGTTIIHYKGESTRKSTLSYVRTFNEALATFVKKHYSKSNAGLFVLFINIGIFFRALLSIGKRLLKALHMPLLDAIVLLVTLWLLKQFYMEEVRNLRPISFRFMYLTFPVYTLIWIGSLYLNGAYDQPYRGLRAMRGMLIGTVLCLAYFGLLPTEYRYSRAIIIFTGTIGGFVIVIMHELLIRLGILKMVTYDELPKKAVIVADISRYQDTASVLNKVHYAPEIYGRISLQHAEPHALTGTSQMKPLLYSAGIDEVIFCVNGLSYQEIFRTMEYCGPAYDYKIHLPGSQSFVGSNSSHAAGDLYTADKRFNLSSFAAQRNKRMLDMVVALVLLLLLPLSIWLVKQPLGMIRNSIAVLFGLKTWVGYNREYPHQAYLPAIRPGILPCYHISDNYEAGADVLQQMNRKYAEHYTATLDMNFILKNLKYCGRKN